MENNEELKDKLESFIYHNEFRDSYQEEIKLAKNLLNILNWNR